MSPIISRVGFSFGFGRRRNVGPSGPFAFSATGGNINYSDPQYSFFIFTSPGTFTVTKNTNESTAQVFLVAGGGGGGGGGDGREATQCGAGGVVFARIPAPNITPGSYPVSVGGGGAPGAPRPVNSVQGVDSTFVYPANTLTAKGGGRGADWDANPSASPGGSGGGYDTSGYSPYTAGTGIQPTQNPGNPHVLGQFGNPGGGIVGGKAGPGAIAFYTPGNDFGPTLSAVYPGYSYGNTGYGAPGSTGIVIIRTKLST